MINYAAAGAMPHLLNAIYRARRAAFLTDEGAFKTWVMIAPENGEFEWRTGGKSGLATFGDVIIARPATDFYRHATTHLSYHVLMFEWRHEQNEADPDAEMPCGKLSFRDAARLESNLSGLRALSGRMDDVSLERKEHLLRDLWGLWRLEAAHPPTSFGPPDALMTRAAEHLSSNLHRAIDFAVLAHDVGLSPVQFTRRFRRAHGVAPSQHLANLRLKQARALLLETDWTLQKVAEQCGFSNGFYLSRVFSQTMKISPGEFRRTHRV